MRLRRAAPLALALLALAGCRRDPQKAVLGEWANGPATMQFFPGGEVQMDRGDGNRVLARWQIVEKRRMRIQELAATPADYDLSVTRDSLVMCRPGAAAECVRMGRVGGRR